MKNKVEFESGNYYHEILKANADSLLFKDNQDRWEFMKRFLQFILPCSEIFGYVILGNHVHLLIRPHPEPVLKRLSLELNLLNIQLNASELDDYRDGKFHIQFPVEAKLHQGSVHTQIISSIRSLKVSYKQYYNRKYETNGTLWNRKRFTKILPFREDINRTIIYIHNNPVLHGLTKSQEEWEYSSFQDVIIGNNKFVVTHKIVDFFGSMDKFKQEHFLIEGEFGRKSRLKD